jgi:hypothetical protein
VLALERTIPSTISPQYLFICQETHFAVFTSKEAKGTSDSRHAQIMPKSTNMQSALKKSKIIMSSKKPTNVSPLETPYVLSGKGSGGNKGIEEDKVCF